MSAGVQVRMVTIRPDFVWKDSAGKIATVTVSSYDLDSKTISDKKL
jgi:hypothetical protein